jgi:hypothetical protein
MVECESLSCLLLTHTHSQVKVVTSTSSDPYDGDVYISLTGLDGSSEEQRLTNSKPGNFLPDATAEFTIKVRRRSGSG